MHALTLFLHICSGIVGLLSGGIAICFGKGSHRHAVAGNVFVVSMMTLGVSGTLLAVPKHQVGNVFGGIITCYLVGTAWNTMRRRGPAPSRLDWAALLVISSVAIGNIGLGTAAAISATGRVYGQAAGPYLFTSAIAMLASVSDIRMIVRGGFAGTQRLVRHLWRMCFAWFVASGSIFLARPRLFPVVMRRTYMLVFLGFLPLLLMLFWLLRVCFAKLHSKKPLVASRASA
jgi:hypothetical protein